MHSASVRGYFRQFKGLIGWIEQEDSPFDPIFKNRHLLGNRQQAPQLTHLLVLFFATGMMAVKVLFIFSSQVFLFL